MTTPTEIFGVPKALIGMIHVGALPGTPQSRDPVDVIAQRASDEARLLSGAGFDALLIENMHDTPYLRREVGPEIVAGMTAVALAVRSAASVPVGVQILAGANRAALAVAHSAGLQFIRAEGFVFASVADEGLLDEADAGSLLRYRRQIGAERVRILADVKKKHSSHALTADVGLAETVRAAEFFGADGVVITGVATARPTSMDDLREARSATALPVIVGSGATPDILADLFRVADAVIMGSWFKAGGVWSNPPDPARVKQVVDSARRCRGR